MQTHGKRGVSPFEPKDDSQTAYIFLQTISDPRRPRSHRHPARLLRLVLDQGLEETIDDINPIEDYTGNYAVEFGDYEFHDPPLSLECRDKDMTYAAPLFIAVSFVNRETGEIREQNVFMGDFPMMTEQGTFIINGTERVIVTQLVRSPGAYVMAAKDTTKQVLSRTSCRLAVRWLEFEIDKRGVVNVRIDRKRKLPATVFLRALAGIKGEDQDDPGLLAKGTDEEILALFDDNLFIAARWSRTPCARWKRLWWSSSRSSAPASRPRWRPAATCCGTPASTPSATT